ncbi:MAG: hypothetical protein IJY39_02600 [Clostridia bacterium]|nr:hypothetical protein [Clostridia bacterium]
MNKMIKLISMLLTVFMLLSSLSALFTVEVFAAETETETKTETESGTEKSDTPTVEIKEEIDYTTELFATPEEKLASMRLALEKDGYQLYVDDYSGEVACVNTATGEKIFTNPYDVGASTGNETTKYEILSQIIVKFTDQQGQNKTFTSYEEAVLRGQVVTEPIKNGLRVEYTIGREQTKTLVPRLISKERFDDIIMSAAIEAFGEDGLYSDEPSLEAFKFQKFLTYYVLYSKETLDVTKEEKDKMNSVFGGVYDGLINSDRSLAAVLKDYPIVDNMAVYVFDPNASESEIAMCEELILTYCPEYTYEELEYDHALTDYESEDENPPVFRMALEYKLDGEGLSVRLPANGIRFNESLYTLSSIEVLPYMGAGNSGYAGYNFFPDGSGTLFDYEQLNTKQTRSVMGKVYGTDFAYHEITGTYQKVIRYPVFGIVEESSFYTYTTTDIETGEVVSETKLAGAIVEAIRAHNAGEETRVYTGKAGTLATKYGSVISNMDATETYSVEKRGFVAIIEEGDALASLATYHAGSLSDYNTIKMSFTPRPKDSYNLRDSISVGSNSEWTVVSDRKYVGGYKMRYIMLSDPEAAAEKGAETYDASWLGMAVAYRDYLTEQGVLTKLTSDELTEDIPLYIETFGATETTEKILSVPVTVMAPLTTFEDVLQMYNELSAQGIKNINFKLTGYANGGMYYSVPGKLKFEKAVGGNDGFQELLDAAAEINASDKNSKLGIFPDFDLVFEMYNEWFDGYRRDDHAAKTIDDRYANRREYSATQQKYENFYELVVSPAYFYVLYERITKNYAEKYDNVLGISVSTLGSWLNSDFDEDEPYNREDSKSFTIKAFEYLDGTYSEVMTDGGNSYVWKYVDHMLDVSLDSSRYNFSANAVPFIGVVLHGSVSFTGEPLNMEGDLQYAILKAIENGASPYFILSMRNTQILKEYFDLSQYYSIRYDIWNKDIADVYNTLNDTLKDVQDKYITNHEFLTGERVPDSDELEADILNEYLADLEAEQNAAEIIAKEIALAASVAREQGRDAEAYAAEAVIDALALYTSQLSSAYSAITFDTDYYDEVIKAYKLEMPTRPYSSYRNSKDEAEKALYAEYNRARTILSIVTDYNQPFDEIVKLYDEYSAKVAEVSEYSQFSSSATRLSDTYKKYANSKTDADRERYLKDLAELIPEHAEKATLNKLYVAADNALDLVISSGFNLTFEECYNVYLAYENSSYYASYGNLLKNHPEPREEDLANYAKFVEAKVAMQELEARAKTFKQTKGSVDNYIVARAQLAVATELGYETTEDEALHKYYTNAKSQVTSTRTTAINSAARVDGATLNALKETVETLQEHLDLATAAIETLAIAEGITVEYKANSDRTVRDITNYDEIAEKSLIVKQAIDRATNTADYLEKDSYEIISDGRETDYELNGHTLYYTRNEQNEKLYFYGTYEAGYSYFTMTTAEDGTVSFEVYHKGSKTGAIVDSGLEIYEYSEKGQNGYYTASLETGYTYYDYDENYNTYNLKAPTVYNGEKVAELEDGTVIYLDGEIYYSVNEDGTFTRYNYYLSVNEYYELALAKSEEIKALAEEKSSVAGDETFAEDVQKRIDRNNASIGSEEEEVEEEVVSRYTTENIVAVTYGNDDNTPYKTILLNYNNYSVRIVYDGIEYTIPAYEFVVIQK